MISNELAGRIFTIILEGSFAATILGLIVLALERCFRKSLSPAWLFALYLPVLLRFLLPIVPQSPTSLLNLPRWISADRKTPPGTPETVGMEITFMTANSSIVPSHKASSTAVAPPSPQTISVETATRSSRAFEIFSLVSLSITCALLLRLIVGAIRFSFQLARQPSAHPHLVELLARVRRQFNARANPRLIETNLVDSPCLFGLFRPKLLVPSGLAQRLSDSELRHVYIHELAHLKRRDLWVNCLMSFAQAIHWFNPFAWLLFRRMKLQRELACDRLVLELEGANSNLAKAYGETLLKLIQNCGVSSRIPATVGIVESRHGDEQRLRQIAAFKPARSNRITGSAIVFVLVALGLSNAQNPSTPVSSEEPKISNEKIPARQNFTSAGIKSLEGEYRKQKDEVEVLQKRLDKLRLELGLTSAEAADPSGLSEMDEQLNLKEGMRKVVETFRQDKALLRQIKGQQRENLRKSLPTTLQPPDDLLNRHLGDLAAAEQKLALLSHDFSDEHPEVIRVTNLIATINRQIENRIDGIISGLEARTAVRENLVEELKSALDLTRAREARTRERFAPYFETKRTLESAQRILDTIFMRLLSEKVDAQVGNRGLQGVK